MYVSYDLSTVEKYHKPSVHYYIYEGWNFNSGKYLFTTDTK